MVHGVLATEDGGLIISHNHQIQKYSTFDSEVPSSVHDCGSEVVERLGLTPCHKYLIGIVPGDKSLLVLNASDLSVVSIRQFPKRPSAWAVASNPSQLLVADKLGDVYGVEITSTESIVDKEGHATIQSILGHISVLLDIAVAPSRVFTADRDEHIRVSRYPNCYVIDKFLFGHEEYVSRLAVSNDYLVSGGGDKFVICWNWKTGEKLGQLDLDLPNVNCLRITADGKNVFIGNDFSSQLIVAELPTLTVLEKKQFDSPLTDIYLGPTDTYVSTANNVYKNDQKKSIDGESKVKTWSAAALKKPEFSHPSTSI